MKKCLIRNDFTDLSFQSLCGVNLLKDISPVILDKDNNVYEEVFCFGLEENNVSKILERFNPEQKDKRIEIHQEAATIIYDLGETKQIDRIYISGYYNSENDYSIAEYELYSSNSIEAIFNHENMIVSYNNIGLCQKSDTRNHCDQVFDIEDYNGRYFAIKILKPNTTDNIIRISSIALYNHKLTEELTFVKNNFEYNILSGIIPNTIGSYNANLTYLTDGICFRENCRVKIDAQTKFLFKLEASTLISSIGFVGSYSALENCSLYFSDDQEDIWNEENIIEYDPLPHPTSNDGVAAATLIFQNDVQAKYIGIEFNTTEGFIDEITASSSDII